MPPFDPKKPARSVETGSPEVTAPKTLVTAAGVHVIVKAPPPAPPAPERKPEPPEQLPRVTVAPVDQAAQDREKFMKGLREHGKLLDEILRDREDVLKESRKDLRQRVLMILTRHVAAKGPPRKLRAFLVEVVNKEVANHKNKWRAPVQQGADGAAKRSDAMGPESAAELAERREKLERYLTFLPEEQAEVIRCVYLWAMTIDETAEAVGRPRGTVSTQLASGLAKLKELANASERGTILGGGRRPSRK
jgi:RNA polymerase sigma factor (sigma-70 family)